jgi:hypothetical protein
MSKLNIVIVALCAFAAGLGTALIVASVLETNRDRPRTATENQRFNRRLSVEKAKSDSSDAEIRPPADWGALANLPKYFGPTTPFPSFLSSLERSGAWEPYRYAEITMVTGVTPFLELNLTVGGDNMVHVLAVVGFLFEEGLYVTVLFRPDPLCPDLSLAGERFSAQVAALGRAISLNAEELRRLDAFTVLIPQCRPAGVEQGMLMFIGMIPAHVREVFTDSFTAYKENPPTHLLDPPAVGGELSDRWVVDLVFSGTETEVLGNEINYRKPGPWWSLLIHAARWRDYTTAEKPKGDEAWWPRINTAEMDQIADALGP